MLLKKIDRINYIIGRVAEYYGITREQLLNRARRKERRHRKVVLAYILYEFAECNYSDVSKALYTSDRNVAYVSSLIFEARMDDSKKFKDEVKNILQTL